MELIGIFTIIVYQIIIFLGLYDYYNNQDFKQ
jgi:hypothetical protein